MAGNSFRDRFFTRKVSHAITAPSSILTRVTHHGVHPGKAVWSAALPRRYFGITH